MITTDRPTRQTRTILIAVDRTATLISYLALLLCFTSGLSVVFDRDNFYLNFAGQLASPLTYASFIILIYAISTQKNIAKKVSFLTFIFLVIAQAPPPDIGLKSRFSLENSIKIYSANIHHENKNIELIRKSIDSSGADIVVLVETSRLVSENYDHILHKYRYVSIHGNFELGSRDGIIIASRYPIAETSRKFTYPPQSPINKYYATAKIITRTGPINVIACHIPRPFPKNSYAAHMDLSKKMRNLAWMLGQRTILVGDFNSSSTIGSGRVMQEQSRLLANPSWLGTWPANVPAMLAISIDQIYHSPDLVFVDRKLGLQNGSDHRPIITSLAQLEKRGTFP